MFPFRYSSIFKSRWMALFWAAGICWFAYDVADMAAGDKATTTDATGATVSDAAVADLKHKLEGL